MINLFRALAHAPGALRLLLPYSTFVRYELSLRPDLRELAILIKWKGRKGDKIIELLQTAVFTS